MFAQPVDPERDGCPDYLTKIKNPMDLGTVRKKLEDNEYDTITQWKADVELIWENSFTYNGKNSLVSVLARQLQTFFKSMTEYITENERDDWLNKFNDLRGKLNALRPKAPKRFEPPKALKKETHNDDSKERIRPTRTSSQTPKKETRQPVQRTMSARQSPVQKKTFGEDDIVRLTEDVNSLAEEHMDPIVELIKRYEPHLMDGSEEIEIDVNKLKVGTLHALRALVDHLKL